jgi:protocatechuate 4,5-dioxygenase alpha chain
MPAPIEIHQHLAEIEDIPGTRVFTAARARRGYWINQFAMSLMKPQNRERFKADEKAYLDEWPVCDEARQALLDRNYNQLLDLGGNVFFLVKLFSTDGVSVARAVSTMTELSFDDYQQMMLNGGRSAQGQRSIKGGY